MASAPSGAQLIFPSGIDVYSTKVNYATIISGESHQIPGSPYQFYLNHLPLETSPSNVNIPGYVETSGVPASFQFVTTYSGNSGGLLTFNSAQSSDTVSVTYTTGGDISQAGYINDTQNSIINIENYILNTLLASGSYVNVSGGNIFGNLNFNGGSVLTVISGGNTVGKAGTPFSNMYANNLIANTVSAGANPQIQFNTNQILETANSIVLNAPSGIALIASGSSIAFSGSNMYIQAPNVNFSGNIIPSNNGVYNLGTFSNPWETIYVNGIISPNASGTGQYVLISGSTMTGPLIIISTLNVGNGNTTLGQYSAIIGTSGTINASNSINVGVGNSVNGFCCQAFGSQNATSNNYSYVEGFENTSLGIASHAEGAGNNIASNYSHGEGFGNNIGSLSNYAHAEGFGNYASGISSHVEGYQNLAGLNNTFTGDHAEGYITVAIGGTGSHAEGLRTLASGASSHAEGALTSAIAPYSHSEGYSTSAFSWASHTEGYNTNAFGQGGNNYNGTHAEGYATNATGTGTHAQGYETTAIGTGTHTEGNSTFASGNASHAQGYFTNAIGSTSHAEGFSTFAYGVFSHAQGSSSIASGNTSFAAGTNANALHDYSIVFADSSGTSSTNTNQFTMSFTNGISLSSGTNFLTTASGINNIGSISNPFNTTFTNAISGAAALQTVRAWVNFSGSSTGANIRDSFGVNSVTRVSAGEYVIVWTNPFANNGYTVSAEIGENTAAQMGIITSVGMWGVSGSSIGMVSISGASAFDFPVNMITAFGRV